MTWAIIEKVQPSCSVRHKQKSLLIPLLSVSKKPSEIGDQKKQQQQQQQIQQRKQQKQHTDDVHYRELYSDLIGQDLCSIVADHTLTVV